MLRNTAAAAALAASSLAITSDVAQAGKDDDTLRVALAEEILNLD